MKRLLVILGFVASAAAFNGCGPSRYSVSEQPVAPIYERSASPGAGYVWVDGNWYRHGGRYRYHNGYWARPGRGRTVYISGNWQHRGNGYYWQRGHWQ